MTIDTETHIGDDWDDDDDDIEFDLDEDAEDFEMVQRDHRMSPQVAQGEEYDVSYLIILYTSLIYHNNNLHSFALYI